MYIGYSKKYDWTFCQLWNKQDFVCGRWHSVITKHHFTTQLYTLYIESVVINCFCERRYGRYSTGYEGFTDFNQFAEKCLWQVVMGLVSEDLTSWDIYSSHWSCVIRLLNILWETWWLILSWDCQINICCMIHLLQVPEVWDTSDIYVRTFMGDII